MTPNRALLRGLRVLEAVAAEGKPAGPTRIAETVELDKATTARLLYTLRMAGYLRIVGTAGQYTLSSKLLQLSAAGPGYEDTRRMASPRLARLTEESQETVHLGVVEDGRVIYIDKFDPPVPIRLASSVGQSNPINVTALGKAFLAALPPDGRQAVLDSAELAVPRGSSSFDLEALLAELELVAERGFAVDQEENEEGVCCVGSAILGPDGKPVAAVSISGPTFRMEPRFEELGKACHDVALAISADVGGGADDRSGRMTIR